MKVYSDPAYAAQVLHRAGTILNDDIAKAVAAASKRYGRPMKVTDITLKPVAEEPRDVYDVFLTFEPATPDRTGETNEPSS